MSESDKLMVWMPEKVSLTKRELVRIINAQAHELSAIMGLLDGYEITRTNLSTGRGTLSPYGRIVAAMELLHKCGANPSEYNGDADDPDGYQQVVFAALLSKQETDTPARERRV